MRHVHLSEINIPSMPFPFETEYHYHFKTAYCIPLSGHHIRSRSRPYFCMVLQIRNNGKDTSIHSKSSEQGFDKVEKFRG